MIEIIAPQQVVDARLTLPGSKYIANRLLILAALTKGSCRFENTPVNDDIKTAQQGLTNLGASFKLQAGTLISQGFNGSRPIPSDTVFTSHSGTFSRFVVAVAALSDQWVSIAGSKKMNSRPMADLFTALRDAGVEIEATDQETLPARIKGPIKSDQITISGAISSQYISALLLVGAKLSQGLVINLTSEPVSKPYLKMTIELLMMFGIKVKPSADYRRFDIAANQTYKPTTITVPTDPSSASYFLAYAAINGCQICLENYNPEFSVQGEAQFSSVLEQMGCRVWQDESGFYCQGPDELKAVDVDMGDMPDVVQTLAVVAAFAKGDTRIRNIENLAYKESNRIEDTATELRKTGLEVETTVDSITIKPRPLHSAQFETYDDHRMAMSLGLLASRVTGITMSDSEVVSKSFPTYWHFMQQLGFTINNLSEE